MLESRDQREQRYNAIAQRYAERYKGTATHAELLGVYRKLKSDLLAANNDLDADSVRDWPSDDPTVVAAELTLFQQLELLHARCAILAEHKNTISAEVLRRRVANLIADAYEARAGFRAPPTVPPPPPPTMTPPPRIRIAIKYVREFTPRDAPLARAQPGDSAEVSLDRRRIALWAQELEV